ncbi:MAG TPA: RNA 2',3'-cyclic phosphodiesterase [Acidimicrobiales bacterium]|nr:RNA 2',3'-cyclic phosphodiesterase [Acidimicrobiales bacterium]
MRLFVAVDPPLRIVELLDSLPQAADRGLRWTGPNQWHVTLRFLGEVDEPAAVATALAGITHTPDLGAVEAQLGPATAWFPGGRVLQVPVAGLDALARAVSEATAPWGPAEPPAFAGHLTLARTRGRTAGPAGLAGTPVATRFDVTEVVLYESRRGPGGPTYEALATVPLGSVGPLGSG